MHDISNPDLNISSHFNPEFLTANSFKPSSSTSKREPTPEEKKLAKLLIERVLPPFSKSLKLQALVVYQADSEKMNCLLVNQSFDKKTDCCSIKNHNQEIDFCDSGFVDSSGASNSPCKPENSEFVHKTEFVSSSRRKRKLSRPCKIPQNVSVVHDLSTTISSQACTLTLPTTTPNTTPPKLSTETIAITKTGTSNGVFLPVSAVTLLPHVSVLSIPVTVLSTVPRPILPRICPDKQAINRPAVSSVPQTCNAVQSNSVTSTLTTSKITISKECIQPIDDNSLNRRYAKSFVCNQCRKSFSSLSSLGEHTFTIHQAFKCTICGAQFTQRSNLQRHSLRHVGFKPFICKLCDKAYYRKDHLVRHIEVTHPGCEPRINLTVKLSSAECLDYLDQLKKQDDSGTKQVKLLSNNSPVDDKNNNGSVDSFDNNGTDDQEQEEINSQLPSITNCNDNSKQTDLIAPSNQTPIGLDS